MYAHSEQGQIIGKGYGTDLQREHLREAQQYNYESSGNQESDPIFGHINPANLLKLFVDKSYDTTRRVSLTGGKCVLSAVSSCNNH